MLQRALVRAESLTKGEKTDRNRKLLTRERRSFAHRTAFVWLAIVLSLAIASKVLYFVFKAGVEVMFCNGSCIYIALSKPGLSQSARQWPSDLPCNSEKQRLQQRQQHFQLKSEFTLEGDELEHVKIIHQTWKSAILPPLFRRLSAAWREKHPGWTYCLWTDSENRELVRSRYPQYLPLYDALPKEIHRVDLVRFMYLHAFGGIYADLDTEPLVALDKHLKDGVTLGFLSRGHLNKHAVPNALMASSQPGHPFWAHALVEAAQRVIMVQHVESFAGPVMLTDLVHGWTHACGQEAFPATGVHDHVAGDVHVLRGGSLYPHDWSSSGREEAAHICSAADPRFDTAACKKALVEKGDDALTVTYWTQTWKKDGVDTLSSLG